MKNKIFLFILLGLFLISFTSASTPNTWEVDLTINASLTPLGDGYQEPEVFFKDESWYLLQGENTGGKIDGFVYNSSNMWQLNSTINGSLGGQGNLASPSVFFRDGVWHAITGASAGVFYGYTLAANQTTWLRNTTEVGGLPDIGDYAKPDVFYKDGTWYMIVGTYAGTYNGYTLASNMSTWIANSTIISGLPDAGANSAPTVFNLSSDWYLITGNDTGLFKGYALAANGTTWIANSTIMQGLVGLDIGDWSTPNVFYKDGTLYMISGENGGFYGYKYYIESTQIGQINFSQISDNSSTIQPKQNQSITHKAYWMSNTTLSTYIFSWNNSGSFVNSTPVTFTGSANWSNVTMNVTNVSGTNIGWIIYANDSEGKWNNTGIKQYTVKETNIFDWSKIDHYWKMDETTGLNVLDEFYTRNGTITGSSNSEQVGILGSAFNVTNSTNRICYGTSSEFSITGNLSYQLWIKPQSGYTENWLFSDWAVNDKNILIELLPNRSLYIASGDGENIQNNIYTSAILNDTWTHLIVTREAINSTNGTMKIYVNGTLNITTYLNSTGGETIQQICNINASAGFFGLIDEQFITSEVLNASEVSILYNSGFALEYGEGQPAVDGIIYSQSEEDNSSSTYPKYFDFVKHWAEWITNATSLSTYIFSWNNSGSWENLSTTEFGANNWSNVTMNVTAVKDSNIGWYIWANDSEGKVNVTSIYQYLVRNSLPTSSIGMFNETGVIYNGTPVKVNVSIGDLDGLADISMVIATIQKNNSIIGDGNTTPFNYLNYASNPVVTTAKGKPEEISLIYNQTSGETDIIFNRYIDSLNQRFFAHAKTTNGITFTDETNLSDINDLRGGGQGYGLGYVYDQPVNGRYYMMAGNFSKAESAVELDVFSTIDFINWDLNCTGITTGGYKKNPAFVYVNGHWEGVFEQGSGSFTMYHWNTSDSNICGTWTKYSQVMGAGGNAWLNYSNGKWIMYYGDMSAAPNNMNVSLAEGTNLESMSLVGKFIVNNSGQSWQNNMVTDPSLLRISDSNNNYPFEYAIYYSGADTGFGLAYDSTNRTFEEAHFGTSIVGTSENLTLSQVGSTSEWSGTFTNTSYIGLYNLTKIYVNDTDNGLNYSSYSTISFTTQNIELDNSSCDVYFNTTSPITYPNRFTVYTNCSSDYTLYRNGTSISNGTSIDGVGYYNLSVVRTNQGSYNNIFDDEFFTINTFDDGCSIFFNETSPVYYPNTFTVWTNCSTGTLRRNNTEITNNSEQDLTYGVYNFSFQRTDTQNYTTTYLDEYFTILDSTPPTINVILPPYDNYIYWLNYTENYYDWRPWYNYDIKWVSYGDNLDTCWFENITNFGVIRTNTTIACNENATLVNIPINTNVDLRFYANDTSGNIFGLTRNDIRNQIRIDNDRFTYLNTSLIYNNETFSLKVNSGDIGNLSEVNFVLNNIKYSQTPVLVGSGFNVTDNIFINESVVGTYQYYWEFDFGEGFFNSTIYNLTIGTSPVITINSPTNSTYYLTSASPNVTINFSVADDNFVNATYNVNGTNMTSLSNETQVNLNLSTGIYNLYVWAIDGNGFIDYETLVFSVKNLNQLTPTYTSSIYETQTASYIVNLTDLYNTNLSAVTLFINGSSYTPTQSGYIWNYTRQSPANYLNNISLIWQLTYSGVNYNTTTYYQLINPINFGLCNATYTVPYLNLSFKDEATNISINGTIQSSTFVYYLGNGTANKTVYYSTSSNYTDYRFCFLPGNLTYYIYPSVSYNLGTDYPLRTWNPATKSYTNSTTNQTLYLLSTSTGSYVTFQVVNSADQPLSNVNVNATRLIDGISTVVAQGTTDSAGSIQFWLNPDYLHTFMFSKSGYTTFTTSLFPTEAEYTITLGGSSSSSGGTTTDYTRGIKLFVYPKSKELQNDTTYNFIFNMTSSYWDVDEYGFSLRLSNGTIIGTDTEVTEESGTSISYNVNNQSIIYMDYYYDIDGNYINNTVRWVVTNSLNTDWSIKTLVEDANTYMDSGLFGLDNFGRLVISFLLLFLVVGIVGYKYGVVSPFFMSVLTFAVVFFLDVITGILPAVRGVEHLLTYVAGLIALLVVVWDLTR